MVQRLLKLFHREFGNLHTAAMLLAISAGASSLLGLFRDRLLAGSFGAGKSLDIYYASFRIPDFLYVFSLSIVSITVLIPFFLERASESPEKARAFLNNIFTVFLYTMIILIIVLFFTVPYLTGLIAPGFSSSDQGQLIILTRILLLSPLLIGLSNLFSSVTQSFHRFFIYALSPILYNIGIIIGILVFYPLWGLDGIVAGVLLGALMHFLIQVPGVIKVGFLPRIIPRINFSELKQVLRLSLPRSLGLGMNEIVLIFITAIASMLSTGSIAVFNLSFNLRSVPLGVIGVSYTVAAFPTLSRYFVKNQKKEFIQLLVSAGRQIIFWSLPASILLIVLRAQIVRVILGTGSFGWTDTRLVAAGLALFSLSITAQAMIILFVRGFYAAGKTKTPLLVNVSSSVFIIGLVFLLVWLFDFSPAFKGFFEGVLRVQGIEGTNMLMLPLAFSIGMIFNVIVLTSVFSRFIKCSMLSSLKETLTQVLLASFLMGGVTYFFLIMLSDFFNIQTALGIFFQGFIAGVLGIAVWCVALRIAKNRELQEIIDSFKRKFWDVPVIAQEPDEL